MHNKSNLQHGATAPAQGTQKPAATALDLSQGPVKLRTVTPQRLLGWKRSARKIPLAEHAKNCARFEFICWNPTLIEGKFEDWKTRIEIIEWLTQSSKLQSCLERTNSTETAMDCQCLSKDHGLPLFFPNGISLTHHHCCQVPPRQSRQDFRVEIGPATCDLNP